LFSESPISTWIKLLSLKANFYNFRTTLAWLLFYSSCIHVFPQLVQINSLSLVLLYAKPVNLSRPSAGAKPPIAFSTKNFCAYYQRNMTNGWFGNINFLTSFKLN
jgi:hypothetical protein